MTFATELNEGLSIAWNAIRANKLRSMLTTLGIVIGIVTVTLMGTAIAGFRASFMKAIASFGTDVFHVQRFSWFISSEEDWRNSNKPDLLGGGHIRKFRRGLNID